MDVQYAVRVYSIQCWFWFNRGQRLGLSRRGMRLSSIRQTQAGYIVHGILHDPLSASTACVNVRERSHESLVYPIQQVNGSNYKPNHPDVRTYADLYLVVLKYIVNACNCLCGSQKR